MEVLLANGANVKLRDFRGATTLYYAVKSFPLRQISHPERQQYESSRFSEQDSFTLLGNDGNEFPQ